MIGQLTSLALMVAALLFVLSLPLGEHDAGRALRRAAAFAFVLAFVPATLYCLVAPLFHRPHSTGALIELLLAACPTWQGEAGANPRSVVNSPH